MPFTSADDDDDAVSLRTGCFRVVRSPPPPPVLFLPLVVLIEETPFWVDDKALPATDDDDDIIIIIINVPPNASKKRMNVKVRTKVSKLSKGGSKEKPIRIKPSKAFCRPVCGTRRSGWFSAVVEEANKGVQEHTR